MTCRNSACTACKLSLQATHPLQLSKHKHDSERNSLWACRHHACSSIKTHPTAPGNPLQIPAARPGFTVAALDIDIAAELMFNVLDAPATAALANDFAVRKNERAEHNASQCLAARGIVVSCSTCCTRRTGLLLPRWMCASSLRQHYYYYYCTVPTVLPYCT